MDVESVSLPSDAIFFCLLGRVDEGLHTLVIVRIRFHQVDYVEAIDLIFPRVRYSEIVPLGVAIRPVIILQEEIVLKVVHFDGFPEISALESTFKYECLISGVLELIIRFQVLVVAIEAWPFGV